MKQKVEIMEALFGCETKNKYKLKNSMGQEVYSAKEDTDCCTRNCCGPIRPFGMTIKDNNDQERHRTGLYKRKRRIVLNDIVQFDFRR